jgi:hypothetical protein
VVWGNKSLVNGALGLIRGMAIPRAPNKIVTGTQQDVILKIEIKGIADFIGLRTVSGVFVEINLQGRIEPA